VKTPSSIVERDTAVSELRDLRKRAEGTAQDIGQELLRWKKSLGFGKFKRAYFEAGWTENQVYHYLSYTKNEALPALETKPDVVESVSQPLETTQQPRSRFPQIPRGSQSRVRRCPHRAALLPLLKPASFRTYHTPFYPCCPTQPH
jgi:hypothetical protein